QVDAAGGGVRGEHVVAVVQTPQRHLDARPLDCEREAVEAVELDVRRGDLWRRPRKVVVGAAVDTVVSDVDRVEDEARSATWTRARVGGVRQGRRRDRYVVQSVPE